MPEGRAERGRSEAESIDDAEHSAMLQRVMAGVPNALGPKQTNSIRSQIAAPLHTSHNRFNDCRFGPIRATDVEGDCDVG